MNIIIIIENKIKKGFKLNEKRTEKIEPSFGKLIKWVIIAVVIAYLATLSGNMDWKIIKIILAFFSILCALLAIGEAYLIHMGQDVIDDTIDKMKNNQQ